MQISQRVAWISGRSTVAQVACIVAVSFLSLEGHIELVSKQAGERRSAPGVSKNTEKGFFFSSLPLAPYFSRSLAVLFPLRAFENIVQDATFLWEVLQK